MNAMTKNPLTAVLAHHLGRQDKIMQWVTALPDFVTVVASLDEGDALFESLASAEDPGVVDRPQPHDDRLKILIDGGSQKMVTQLYQDYVSEENFVLFIEFVKGMDRYISKFRDLARSRDIADQVPSEEDEEGGAEVGRGRGRGRRGRRGGGGGQPAPALDAVDGGQPAPREDELNRADAPNATIAGFFENVKKDEVTATKQVFERAKKGAQFEAKPVEPHHIEKYLHAVTEGAKAYHAKHYPNIEAPVYKAQAGDKYYRVVKTNKSGTENSAHSFVEKATGHILKPAGWKKPAPQPRGTVHSPGHGGEYVSLYGPGYLK